MWEKDLGTLASIRLRASITGSVLWPLWSSVTQSWQMQQASAEQKSSRGPLWLSQVLLSMSLSGSTSRWFWNFVFSRWGRRWDSQYDTRQVRQDLRALRGLSMQESHTTSSGPKGSSFTFSSLTSSSACGSASAFLSSGLRGSSFTPSWLTSCPVFESWTSLLLITAASASVASWFRLWAGSGLSAVGRHWRHPVLSSPRQEPQTAWPQAAGWSPLRAPEQMPHSCCLGTGASSAAAVSAMSPVQFFSDSLASSPLSYSLWKELVQPLLSAHSCSWITVKPHLDDISSRPCSFSRIVLHYSHAEKKTNQRAVANPHAQSPPFASLEGGAHAEMNREV